MAQRKTARRDKVEIYLHLIWTTWDRQLWIEPEWEGQMFAVIHAAVEDQHCFLLAAGGVEDHVHLLVALHATTPVGELMKSIKGTSAKFGRLHNPAFKWRPTYAAFSVSRGMCPTSKRIFVSKKNIMLREQRNPPWKRRMMNTNMRLCKTTAR